MLWVRRKMLQKIMVSLFVCMMFMLVSCTQGEYDSKYSKANPNQTNNQHQQEKNLDEDQITTSPEKKEEPVPEAEKEISSEEKNIKVTFIELGSKGCVPCDMMQPIMDEIKSEYPNQVKVIFYDVRTQDGYAYAQKYKIRVIPTQVFLDNEGNEYFRHEGFYPKEELLKVFGEQGVKLIGS